MPSGEYLATTALRRSVPFLRHWSTPEVGLYVDSAGLVREDSLDPRVLQLLIKSLDLSAVSEQYPAGIAADLISTQYDVCLDYVYSHPLWETWRSGDGRAGIIAYLIETRHYLEAAALRMAPGPASAWHDGGATTLLAEHLLEEIDHARFFEEGLRLAGIEPEVGKTLRPAPVTTEWIVLMRSLASRDPLVAATCSGLMESSASNRAIVREWHHMLWQSGLLPRSAAEAVAEHVELDYQLGHGENWRDVVSAEAPLSARQLRDCLNSICAVAEMLVRWLDQLRDGLSGRLGLILSQEHGTPVPETEGPEPRDILDPLLSGLPVWPARILSLVSHAGSQPGQWLDAVAIAYHISSRGRIAFRSQTSLDMAARELLKPLSSDLDVTSEGSSIEATVREWLRAIDGHEIWSRMRSVGGTLVVHGWVLENFFYLRAAARHVSAAIASCSDPSIRVELIKHLSEEVDHARLLEDALMGADPPITLALCRPLPTTVAFIGYLTELARSDWEAYCLALGFLQLSLSPGDERHSRFYQSVLEANPAAHLVMRGIMQHDEVDGSLGHEEDLRRLLSLLSERHTLSRQTFERAALLAQLSWSFLDGILSQYSVGPHAVAQRLGWHAYGVAVP